MRVGCLQLDVRGDDPRGNLERVEGGLREGAELGLELCVLPEMWPTSFCAGAGEAQLDWSERAVERALTLSAELALVVVGTAYSPGAEGRAPFNRLHVLDRGRRAGSYDKLHLFSPTAEPQNFSAGDAPPRAIDTSVGRIAGVVCYDLRFPEPTRAAFRDGAELLCVPAQWPRSRAAHWDALVPGRAVEGLWYVAACNRSGRDRVGRRGLELDFPGNSIVASPDGEVLARGTGEAGWVVSDCDLARVRELRRRVPVEGDERAALYSSW